jgi:hypothetical protein
MRKGAIWVTITVLAATQIQAQAPSKVAADADRQAIARLRDQELPALASGDAEKLVALFGPPLAPEESRTALRCPLPAVRPARVFGGRGPGRPYCFL